MLYTTAMYIDKCYELATSYLKNIQILHTGMHVIIEVQTVNLFETFLT